VPEPGAPPADTPYSRPAALGGFTTGDEDLKLLRRYTHRQPEALHQIAAGDIGSSLAAPDTTQRDRVC